MGRLLALAFILLLLTLPILILWAGKIRPPMRLIVTYLLGIAGLYACWTELRPPGGIPVRNVPEFLVMPLCLVSALAVIASGVALIVLWLRRRLR